MAEPTAVTLGGALAGKTVLVDLDRLNVGTLEDLESQRVTQVKAAVCSLIVGGDLGDATQVGANARALKVMEFDALVTGVLGLLTEKKRT